MRQDTDKQSTVPGEAGLGLCADRFEGDVRASEFGPHVVGSAVAGASGDHHGGAQKDSRTSTRKGSGRGKIR